MTCQRGDNIFTVTTRRDENGGTQSLPIEHPQEATPRDVATETRRYNVLSSVTTREDSVFTVRFEVAGGLTDRGQ